ncbi:hypothetical protein PV10_04124 [Exophiala mesophila]|uniref:Uncharacterized protein n=1 Tax=Exophiala mesophila TaxID=212818 RepID=A0A0D1WUD5_EXOME|nr:uncharacterized protein PV10_04124 [Exophiala mesophila]KIV92860.1 hypothetical protein PV10_04124 [Exophiala mesophila]
MSSSPSSTKQTSPKRTSPKRTPLQERSQSHANEISQRLSKDSRNDQENSSIYNTTPFPTKASHILLPSSLRNRRPGASPAADAFGLNFPNDLVRGNANESSARPGSAQPTVRLKRSVKALRDLYESQEEASRPSTATSPPPRPSTAGSSRLRSISSSDSLTGPYAWESLRKISSDDLALLPSLPQGGRAVKRLSSRSSFTSIAEKIGATSSPNFRVIGATSSPRPPAFQEITSPVLEPFDEVDDSSSAEGSSSSPIVVRLARSSSTDQFTITDSSSSPNVIRLGTSSPFPPRSRQADFSSHSRSSSSSSRKRKRSDAAEIRPYPNRAGARNPLASSPPTSRYAMSEMIPPSSPPVPIGYVGMGENNRARGLSVEESSPMVRMLARSHSSSDATTSSLAETHAHLQDILSSSPPQIQYPIIRAPHISQQLGLAVPKRNSRSLSAESTMQKLSARLSAAPSEGAWDRSRSASQAYSLDMDDINDLLNSDDVAPPANYLVNDTANRSVIRLVPSSDPYEHDPHEATDEVSALPYGLTYRSPPLRPARSNNLLHASSSTSLQRMSSMKSLTQSRKSSFLSLRPSSSGSVATEIVPSWAQRYYSGFYRDSFNYLYATNSQLNQGAVSPAKSSASPTRADASRAQTGHSNRSFADVHRAMRDRIQAAFSPQRRPRVEARRSHTLPGVGPLVSNPATSDLNSTHRQSHPGGASPAQHQRSFSTPLDPRTHWAGIVEIHQTPLKHGRGSSYTIRQHVVNSNGLYEQASLSSSQSVIHYYGAGGLANTQRRWSSSPHLHHDHRLNTGSSVSMGFGYPFNTKSKWNAPSIVDAHSRFWSGIDLRTTQIALFAVGFLLPLTWFVGAFLVPLPQRPEGLGDLEKRAMTTAQHNEQLRQEYQAQLRHHRSGSSSLLHAQAQQIEQNEWEQMDVVAKLRLERHARGLEELKFQNARWWRNLNRWMCVVGVVVIVIVVILAVLGTRGNF